MVIPRRTAGVAERGCPQARADQLMRDHPGMLARRLRTIVQLPEDRRYSVLAEGMQLLAENVATLAADATTLANSRRDRGAADVAEDGDGRGGGIITVVSRPSRHPIRVHGDASIEVWLVELTAPTATVLRAEALLVDEERTWAGRGTPLVYMRRILLRAALRELVGQRLGIRAAAVPLCSGPGGRPQLAGRHARRLDVGCSAGAGVGLIALAEGARVGIDVEPVMPWSRAVLTEGWLSEAECAALLGAPPHERALAATVSWTQKEAVLKGQGVGLPGGAASIPTPIGHRDAMIAGWSVGAVAVPEGHVASLAVADLALEDRGRDTVAELPTTDKRAHEDE